MVFDPTTLVRVLPLESNADPAVVFPLEFFHPQREFRLSGAVALKQCNIFSFEPQTRVFGCTPEAAKGRTHSSVHTMAISSLAAVSITSILREPPLTSQLLSRSVVFGVRVEMAEKPRPELWGTSEKCNHGFLNTKFFELAGENAFAPRNLQDFAGAVCFVGREGRCARRIR